MPAGILAGFVNYLQPILQETYSDIEVWTGEIPRFNSEQQPIEISGTFPAFRVTMPQGGMDREWTTEDPYGDDGNILFECWATKLAAIVNPGADPPGILDIVEAQLCNTSNWEDIPLPGGPIENPYSVNKCLFKTWWYGQIEGVRTQDSSFIYGGWILYSVLIHGAISTR